MIDPGDLELIALTQNLTGIAANLQQLINGLNQRLPTNIAVETTHFEIENTADRIYNEVTDATHGLAHIYAVIVANEATLLTAITDVQTAVGTPQQAGSPVTFPAVPPAGYAPLDATATGDAVWGATVSNGFTDRAEELDLITSEVYGTAYLGSVRAFNCPYFRLDDMSHGTRSQIESEPLPQPDPRNILGSDTLLSWLTRELPTWTINDSGDAPGMFNLEGPSGHFEWLCILDDAGWNQLKFAYTGVGQPLSAPTWPGIANVTLGVPTAFSGDVTVTTPMNGVIVTILTVNSWQGQFDFDGDISYRNIGGVTFQTDNGQDEPPQLLGFASAVYCPKSMTQAASVKLRVTPGVTGTVTPWTSP